MQAPCSDLLARLSSDLEFQHISAKEQKILRLIENPLDMAYDGYGNKIEVTQNTHDMSGAGVLKPEFKYSSFSFEREEAEEAETRWEGKFETGSESPPLFPPERSRVGMPPNPLRSPSLAFNSGEGGKSLSTNSNTVMGGGGSNDPFRTVVVDTQLPIRVIVVQQCKSLPKNSRKIFLLTNIGLNTTVSDPNKGS